MHTDSQMSVCYASIGTYKAVFGWKPMNCKKLEMNFRTLVSHSCMTRQNAELTSTLKSYKKLWKLLIDKNMKKKDLQTAAGISSASITKLAKNEHVNTETLEKICTALRCDISDILEMTETSEG